MINIHSKIFIAGHKGMLGSSLLRVLSKKGYKNLITIDKKKLDLRNQQSVKKFLKKKKTSCCNYSGCKSWWHKSQYELSGKFY